MKWSPRTSVTRPVFVVDYLQWYTNLWAANFHYLLSSFHLVPPTSHDIMSAGRPVAYLHHRCLVLVTVISGNVVGY